MSPIVFHPYVGPRYRNSPCRLMLLGESHYGEIAVADRADTTRALVESWRIGEWRHCCLTIAARILTVLKAWAIDRYTAFDAIVFCNYVQESMPNWQVRPIQRHADAAAPAFHEVLELTIRRTSWRPV